MPKQTLPQNHIAPTAEHIGAEDLPWAQAGENIHLKILHVSEKAGFWVVQNRFGPGVEVQTHRHTGPVFGMTWAGQWGYKESDFMNTAGSYLYEPAHSVHSLYTPKDAKAETDVTFVIYGANLNLDAEGNVESVSDGPGVLQAYYALLEAQGLPRPNNILVD